MVIGIGITKSEPHKVPQNISSLFKQLVTTQRASVCTCVCCLCVCVCGGVEWDIVDMQYVNTSVNTNMNTTDGDYTWASQSPTADKVDWHTIHKTDWVHHSWRYSLLKASKYPYPGNHVTPVNSKRWCNFCFIFFIENQQRKQRKYIFILNNHNFLASHCILNMYGGMITCLLHVLHGLIISQ